jgi:hypothetical protein
MEIESNLTIDDGVNEFGTKREIILEGDQIVEKLTYDAEPLLRYAEQARIATRGDSWGNGHFVGVIPIPELVNIQKTFQGAEERKHAILSYIKNRPKYATFEKFLK